MTIGALLFAWAVGVLCGLAICQPKMLRAKQIIERFEREYGE